jgi:septum formation protein
MDESRYGTQPMTPPRPPASDGPPLVLASTSRYRQALLARLALPFVAVAPDCDETPHPGEIPDDMVRRLAEAKARSVAQSCPGTLIIGSDQVGACDGRLLTKPGNHERAVAQLRSLRGRSVRFVTGLCVLNADSGRCHVAVERFDVALRRLSHAEIEAYVAKDQPFDCAGAFKAEGLGIALFASLSGADPTALVGLPLIRLTEFLAREGRSPLAAV